MSLRTSDDLKPEFRFNKMRIEFAELEPRKLMVATPRFGAAQTGIYSDAFDNLRIVMNQYNLTMDRVRVDNDSYIPRARNTLVDEFLRTDFTHLLFWDADIGATPDDVLGLLLLADPKSDKDIVCGLYPKKHIRWDKVCAAARQGYKADDLENFVGDSVFNPINLSGSHDLYTPMEVSECGTGFMMIQRHVFERFAKAYPERAYRTDHHGEGFTGAYFLGEIEPVSKRLLTEDYNFCRLARAIGLKVWVAPWMNLSHFGNYEYVGNPAAVSALVKPIPNAA